MKNIGNKISNETCQHLLAAARLGDIAQFQQMEWHKEYLKIRDKQERSLLHLATMGGNCELIKFLVDKGANANDKDSYCKSAIDYAIDSRQDDVISILNNDMTRSQGSDIELEIFTEKSNDEPTYKLEQKEITRIFKFSISNAFIVSLVIFQLTMIVLHAIFSTYSYTSISKFPLLQDIQIMIFVGIGLLMSFLGKFGFSTLGLSFMVAVIVFQWHPLLEAFWNGLISSNYHKVMFDIQTLISCDFAAATVLISFGALIGKISVLQIFIIALIEPIFYNLNYQIGMFLSVSDMGGSMTVHSFAAFFGLTVAFFVQKSKANYLNCSSTYYADIFAMIGTLFLWIMWPSFNGAFAVDDSFSIAVTNTMAALMGSCLSAFILSLAIRGKFSMVDIQNATLSGGVSIGTCADFPIGIASALGIGCIAGILSTIGYAKLQAKIERKLGIHDTCGIMNLHAVPSILGGISGALATAFLSTNDFSIESLNRTFPLVASSIRSFQYQAAIQFAFLMISICLGSVSGAIVGLVCKFIKPLNECFADSELWHLPDPSP